MNKTKLFKWLCFRKMSEWLLQEQGFSLPWKKKDTRSSLKAADENLEENLI